MTDKLKTTNRVSSLSFAHFYAWSHLNLSSMIRSKDWIWDYQPAKKNWQQFVIYFGID